MESICSIFKQRLQVILSSPFPNLEMENQHKPPKGALQKLERNFLPMAINTLHGSDWPPILTFTLIFPPIRRKIYVRPDRILLMVNIAVP